MSVARVAVIEAPRRLVVRELPLPALGEADGLLAVEANGVCGSDAEFYAGEMAGYDPPMTVGHEPVGRVVALGTAARFGVAVGDRVVVSSALAGGASYGTLSPDLAPGLWGGIGTHLFLPPHATLIPLAEHVSTAAAAFHNPLANGFEWAAVAGQVGAQSRVVVLGAGPRGLACALVSLVLGASEVTLVGLERDARRLALAEELGVHRGVVVRTTDDDEVRDRLAAPVTVVIDTTPHSIAAVRQGLRALAVGGRLVLAGLKGPGKFIDVDDLIRGRFTLTAPRSKSERSLRRAVAAVESGELPLDRIPTRAYALDEAAAAIESLASADPDRPLHVRVEP